MQPLSDPGELYLENVRHLRRHRLACPCCGGSGPGRPCYHQPQQNLQVHLTLTIEATQQVAMVEALHPEVRVKSVGTDKAYHWLGFVAGCRQQGIAPYVACKEGMRTPGLDGRTTARAGYRLSQKLRQRVEEIFGGGSRR